MNTKTTAFLAFILLTISGYYYFFEVKNKEIQKITEENSKKILQINQEDITSFVYKNNQEGFEAEFKLEGNQWKIIKPFEYKADNMTVDTILNTAVEAKRLDKIENVNLADFGLEKTRIEFDMKTKKGDILFKIGDKSPTGTELYTTKNNSKEIYVMLGYDFKSLNRNLTDLRDKTIFEFARENINYINVHKNDDNLQLKKADLDNWFISNDKNYKVDLTELDDFFDKVTFNKASDFAEHNPKDLNKYGLDKPQLIVDFSKNENKKDYILKIGNDIGSYSYAQTNLNPVILKISKDITQTLRNASIDSLRNKRLLSYETEEIKNVEISTNDKKINIVNNNGRWQNSLEKPDSKEKFKSSDLEAFIDKLAILKYKKSIPKTNEFNLGEKIINVKVNVEYEKDIINKLGKKEKQLVKKLIVLNFGKENKGNKLDIYLEKDSDNSEVYTVEKSLFESILKI